LARTDWRRLWESRLTISPYLSLSTMNPPSPFAADGPILGLSGQQNPALPPGTPRVETPNRQSTLEDRMETLQREMVKMQEHNNILSSKLDNTQKQLHE
ncbi:unnamed protein product, partial [Prunus brigantina]